MSVPLLCRVAGARVQSGQFSNLSFACAHATRSKPNRRELTHIVLIFPFCLHCFQTAAHPGDVQALVVSLFNVSI